MLNRRHLLQLAAAAASSGLLPGTTGNAVAARPDALGAHLSDPELLAALGARCAALLPSQHAQLTALAGLTDTDSNAGLLNRFVARRADDFRAGRVHTVDGWLMAEAECALCVLIARS